MWKIGKVARKYNWNAKRRRWMEGRDPEDEEKLKIVLNIFSVIVCGVCL